MAHQPDGERPSSSDDEDGDGDDVEGSPWLWNLAWWRYTDYNPTLATNSTIQFPVVVEEGVMVVVVDIGECHWSTDTR